MENEIFLRKHFIDNIRSIIVFTVIVYHVFYLYNSAGVIKNIGVDGIPRFDIVCYFVYPWLMTIMFLLAGISAKYAMQKRTSKQFLKERAQKLLIPVLGGMFLIGWINGWVTYQYVDMFGGSSPPVLVKYLIFCLNIGPLWFNIQLFIVSSVLLLILIIDKKRRLQTLSEKANIFTALSLVIPFWGSSFLLNTPLLTTFRNGIYLFVFLAGYFIFSQEKIIAALSKLRFILFTIGVILGIIEVFYFYGRSFSDDYCLQHPLTNAYAWIMMPAILGVFYKYCNVTNKMLDYLKNRSFYWFLCHFPVMLLTAYYLTSFFNFSMIFNYILTLVITLVLTILFSEMIKLIPVLRYFLFGIKNVKRELCAK